MTRQAASTRLTPVAFDANGTVREARGFDLEDEDLGIGDRELHVHQPDDAQGGREPPDDVHDLEMRERKERRRRKDAGGVAGVDPGFLDVLHHRADVRVAPVRDRVDVDLERLLEEAVDEHAALHPLGRRAQLVRLVADAHRAAAEDVGRTCEHRVADPSGDADGLVGVGGHAPRRAGDAERAEQPAEALPVLGDVDRVEGRAEHLVPLLLERARELERRLAAELDDDALGLLPLADREHLLDPERLEVEAIRRVVVGRHRLGVAVDHHRVVAERAEALDGVHAAVVELDPLADPVRAGAEDDDARAAVTQRP